MAHNLSPMWPHFVNLSHRTWEALVLASGTSTFGIFLFSIAIPVVTSVLTAAVEWKRKSRKEVIRDSLKSGGIVLVALIVVLGMTYLGFFVPTVYNDHQTLAKQVEDLSRKNKERSDELETHRHGMVTTDPVFPNTIYLLEAFRMYRVPIGHDAKCTIYVTAPPEAEAIASMTAQFQINVSNCSTFGPMGTDLPPSMQKEALEGSTPGFVTINAPEGDRAADELMNRLTSVFRVKRGYREVPKGRLAEYPTSNAIWIQFGSQAAFASELRERGK
jgi:hypothetical protein